MSRILVGTCLCLVLTAQAGCGIVGGGNRAPGQVVDTPSAEEIKEETIRREVGPGAIISGTVWDLFGARGDNSQVGSVNKYIWNAALETLDFLPIETVDPFSGVIITGFGTPPGGGRAYRATIYVNDPALDARSLNVALITRNGPAAASTVRAVEDAILTRARQIRARDSRL